MAFDDGRQRFFSETVFRLHLDAENEEEIVMDVGCGSGRNTKDKILPLFPHLEKLFAIDVRSVAVECAQCFNPDPRIEYITASIEDWSAIQHWEGRVTKLFSVHCFNFLNDQKLGFENVFKLLKSNGQAALIFYLPASGFQEVIEAAMDSKWKDYLQSVPIPQNNVRSEGYEKVLKELGFDILHMKETPMSDSTPTKEIYEGFLTSASICFTKIPKEKREEFKNEFVSKLHIKGFDKEKTSKLRPTTLELVLQKS